MTDEAQTPPAGDTAQWIGWDVGGANLKAVAVMLRGRVRTLERTHEIWRATVPLDRALAELARELGPARGHAVTMTAELADCFPSKRAGVDAVLTAIQRALPADELRVFTIEEELVSPEEARRDPMAVAGGNWRASTAWLARSTRTRKGAGILLDVGSTTTDVVPFARGRVLARGRTDPERLVEGELVYTGALRTPLCAILATAPLDGRECPVAAEHFAIAADAHLWLGSLSEAEYRCSTPDGGPATRAGAQARLARVVCADTEMLSPDHVTAIAARAAEAQVARLAQALITAVKQVPSPVVVYTAGSGAWLGEEAARRRSLPVEPLAAIIGEAARVLPAFALALRLQEEEFGEEPSVGRG